MNKRILLLSSVSPKFSAGLVADYVLALEKAGFIVDILTKYKTDGCKGNIIYAYETEINTRKLISNTKKNIAKNVLQFVRTKIMKYIVGKQSLSTVFPYNTLRDFEYPVPSTVYLDKLDKKYDLVFVLYMQYMFTERSLKDIYDKLQVPIYAQVIDMYLMTGGCYYPGTCTQFKSGCKRCLFVRNTFQNAFKQHYKDKKEIYKSIDLRIVGGTWAELFFKQSLATKDQPFYKQSIIINENIFSIKDKLESRKIFDISSRKRFVLLAGVANNTPRKGFKYLIKSLNLFYELLPENRRDEVILMLIGRGTSDLKKKFKLDLFITGFLNTELLSLAYSAADIYISPSIDDVGPSMINQALMCGTPVVSFNVGTALDVVRDGETGYAVGLKDYQAMAHALMKLFYLSPEELLKMKEQCRQLSIENSSIMVVSNFFKSIL